MALQFIVTFPRMRRQSVDDSAVQVHNALHRLPGSHGVTVEPKAIDRKSTWRCSYCQATWRAAATPKKCRVCRRVIYDSKVQDVDGGL